MPKRIFIGGLSARTTEADLQRLCSPLEGFSSLEMQRAEDGSQQGVAEFSSDEAGTGALRKLRGERLDGMTIRVSETR